MQRWQVPDAEALQLIASARTVGKNGKRPKFRFITRQIQIATLLAEIDTALAAAGHDPSWLRRRVRSKLAEKSPLQHMMDGGEQAMVDVLNSLNRDVLKASLAKR
jgi:hypothetical protein